MTTPQSSETGGRSIERLAYPTDEACQMLGGISRVSLWRMEKRGLITPSKLLRTKLYSRADLERLLETSK